MFTGIIEEMGRVAQVKKGEKSSVLTIRCEKVLRQTKIGDSIAVNGVCLTATAIGSGEFTAFVMAETMNRSVLSTLKSGDCVNLERAMAADGRFGGHIVSGHVDAKGTVSDISEDDNAIWYTVEMPESVVPYVVEKGSIAINGISLTVAAVSDHDFKVSIIPHTQKETNLYTLGIGSEVNLECDVIGKYVERLLCFQKREEKKESRITEAFLREHGF